MKSCNKNNNYLKKIDLSTKYSEEILELHKSVGNDVGYINFINSDIKGFLLNTDKPNDLESFSRFTDKLNKKIISDFSDKLEKESESFKMCFKYGLLGLLKEEETEELSKQKKIELRELIISKTKLRNYYILIALENGFLDFLPNEDKKSLISIIKSRVFDYINDVFSVIDKELDKDINKEVKGLVLDEKNPKNKDGLKVAGLVDGKLLPHGLIRFNTIKKIFLEDIENKNFKNYFLKFNDLLTTGEMSFPKYVDIQNYALNTWEDKSSKLGMTTTEENYNKGDLLIDLELEIFLKHEANEYKKVNIDLANKYFGNDYGIGEIKFYKVEPILSSGLTSMINILGKSFPNHPKISKERGNFIYSIDSRFGEGFIEKSKDLINSIDINNIDIEAVLKIGTDHVAFHEYGHSNFIHGGGESKLEELKASLFYNLYIYDTFNDSNFNNSNSKTKFVKDFLDFSMIELVRKVKGKNASFTEKYLIREQFFLNSLLKNNLVEFDSDFNVKYNISIDGFNNFLRESKDTLFKIKEIYELGINGKEVEKLYIKEATSSVAHIIDGIYDKIKS